MLNKLSEALKKTTDKIANAIFLDKNLVDQIVKDLQRALIEADVNISLVLEITKKIKQSALDERISGLEKKEHITKLIYDELASILGQSREIKIGKKNIFMLVGLYGAGKTTTIGKLASYYSKRGSKVCALGLDVYRPAAAEQLKQICSKLNIQAFIKPEEKDPKKIFKFYEKDLEKYDLILVDTAGRDSLSDDLIKEISQLHKLIKPSEVFLTLQADIGQTAKTQAKAFQDACKITGVIITKMDSTAKAGGALTACAEVKAPVVFLGVGEKPSDLESFDPQSFLSRLLGLGDLKSLLEKIQSVVDKDKIEEQQARLKAGKFTLKDFQTQLESLENVGSFDKIMNMIPGLGKANIPQEALDMQQNKLKKWKHAINSMTPAEIESPELLEKQTSRMSRVAKGSGVSVSEIRALIKQFSMMQEMAKSASGMQEGQELDQKTMMKFAKKFGRKMRF